MKTFNLSRWALEHKSFVVYLMLLVTLAGVFEYRRLGRDEDPPSFGSFNLTFAAGGTGNCAAAFASSP